MLELVDDTLSIAYTEACLLTEVDDGGRDADRPGCRSGSKDRTRIDDESEGKTRSGGSSSSKMRGADKETRRVWTG